MHGHSRGTPRRTGHRRQEQASGAGKQPPRTMDVGWNLSTDNRRAAGPRREPRPAPSVTAMASPAGRSAATAVPVTAMMASRDLIGVSIGGDGTCYSVALAKSCPILVNLGEVGFLNAVAPATRSSCHRARRRTRGRAPSRPQTGAAAGDRRRRGLDLRPALNRGVVHGPRREPRQRATIGSPSTASATQGRADGDPRGHADRLDRLQPQRGGPLVHPSADARSSSRRWPRPRVDAATLVIEPDTELTLTRLRNRTAYAISDRRNRRHLSRPRRCPSRSPTSS